VTPGDAILGLAAGLAALTAGFALLCLLRGDPPSTRSPWKDPQLVLAISTFGVTTLALALLVIKFVTADLTTFFVWANASPENPWYFRLAGLWASQPGTLLLWSWYMTGGVLILHLVARHHESATRTHHTAVALASGFAAALAAYALGLHVFAATSDFRLMTTFSGPGRFTDWIYAPQLGGPEPLVTRPNGNGLNPLLLSPFMVIHPWLEFAAYAFAGITWAIATANLLSKDDSKDTRTLLTWARVSWAFYTFAIALGAMWAYYTLSFGGYWAWDPVETANLIPWIALTAFLHANHAKRAPNAMLVLAASGFALTLFATFATRTGLWASSVHAFINGTSGTIMDPADRLVAILQNDAGMSDLYRLLSLGVLLPTFALTRRMARDHEYSDGARWALQAHTLLTGAILAFTLIDPVSEATIFANACRGVGRGFAVLGFLGLAGCYFAAPLIIWAFGKREAADGSPKRLDWKRAPPERTLLVTSAAVLGIWALVTLVLLIMGVNGTQRQVYDARVPLIGAAVSSIAFLAFAQRALGRTRAAITTASMAIAGVALAIVLPSATFAGRAAAFDVSFLVGLAALSAWSAARAAATLGGRIARLALITSGITGLLMWTSPPSFVQILGREIHIPDALVPAGILISITVLALAFHPQLGKTRTVTWAAVAVGAMPIGYGASLACALIVLVIALRTRTGREPARKNAWTRSACLGTIPLLHIGVALLFLGYGLSTYLATETSFTRDAPIELGQTVDVGGGYALTFTRSDGVLASHDSTHATNASVYESVTTYLDVSRNGERVGTVPLRMYFVQAKDHYDPSSYVLRQADGDLYINANFANAHAMYSDADGWVVGHGPTSAMTSANITKIAITMRVLPYVNVLWAGWGLLIFAGFARVALPSDAAPRALPSVAARTEPQVRADEASV